MDKEPNGWAEWSRHVLSVLERLNVCYEKLHKEVTDVRVELGMLQVESGMWGLIAGCIPVAIMVIINLLK